MADATGERKDIPENAGVQDARGAAPARSRRKLLLGAAAALPSVYTLSSGAQTAVASNLRCWSTGQASNPARFTATDDQWVRAKVYAGKQGSTPAYCVMQNQAACLDPMDSTKGATGSVWMANGQRVIAGNPGVNITHVSTTQSYGLVYVNQQGTMNTLDQNGSPTLQPVSDSCWTSILGGRISSIG